jgi:hypothetical protein
MISISGVGQIGARAPCHHFLDAGVGVQLHAEVEVFYPPAI